jgi:hypothetical protein
MNENKIGRPQPKKDQTEVWSDANEIGKLVTRNGYTIISDLDFQLDHQDVHDVAWELDSKGVKHESGNGENLFYDSGRYEAKDIDSSQGTEQYTNVGWKEVFRWNDGGRAVLIREKKK